MAVETLAGAESREGPELGAEVKAAAEAYCVALQSGDVAGLRVLFAPGAHLYAADGDAVADLPRDAWLERVAARSMTPPSSGFAIELLDVSGPETAVARVLVGVGPRVYRDYLSFLKVGGSWQVIAKVYRLVQGPAA